MNTKNILLLVQKHYEEIAKARHYFHMYPETAFEEVKTSKKICEVLDKYKIPYKKGIAKTGVMATIVGEKEKSDRCVLLRGDMDALDMPELANVPYRSTIEGKMHGCGHDGHAAGVLGAALVLNDMKKEFSGTVKIIFQPAEESEGGALPMIQEGILENPKVGMAFGAHLWDDAKEGVVKTLSGSIFASPDEFRIKFKGRGGHGSRPDQSISPIVAAGYFIAQSQSIMASMISPFENSTFSFGSIQGGKAFNVIPSEVELVGTSRNFSEEARDKIEQIFINILEGLKLVYGCDYELDYIRRFPMLYNDPKATKIAKNSFGKIVGDANVLDLEQKVMGGEDFSYIAKEVPSCFMLVGIIGDHNQDAKLHNPNFRWDDKILKILSSGLCQCALDYLSIKE